MKKYETIPYPIIVCGDFNDTPVSYTYNKIKGNLMDSFTISGVGIGDSYVKIPMFRIDYIMYDKNSTVIIIHNQEKIFLFMQFKL